MKVQKTIIQETLHIAIGILIADVIMCVIFALLGRFDYTVILGALLGSVFAVSNMFLLGLTIQAALGKGENVKRFMHVSYTGRMLLYVVCIVLAMLVPCFQPVAAIVPLFMPQIVIRVMQALGLYKPEDPAAPPAAEIAHTAELSGEATDETSGDTQEVKE